MAESEGRVRHLPTRTLCRPARTQASHSTPEILPDLKRSSLCAKCHILCHDYQMKSENRSWQICCLINRTPVRPCGFLWLDCIFSLLKMDLPLTKLPEGRALAVFFKHLFFHWETADEFTFREAHTPLIQPQICPLMQNQVEKSFPVPAPPPLPHLALCMSPPPSTHTRAHPRSLGIGILFLTPACVSPLYIVVFA